MSYSALRRRFDFDDAYFADLKEELLFAYPVIEKDGRGLEQLALGETPNIAVRIQGLADPDTLLISAATDRLAQWFFACEALGEYALKGVSKPINGYHSGA